jgi:hypothetical protein
LYQETLLVKTYLQDMVVHHVIAVGHIAVTPVAHGCSAGRHDAIVEFW